MHRYLEDPVRADLAEKMVFVGGPRQVGKTTLAFHLLKTVDESHPAYLNWDVPSVKRSLLKGELPGSQPLVVLDEIHKYKGWRNLIKGFYDSQKSRRQFLVTGSARLDFYRRGGDSLQGRYHYYHLHPLSLHEINLHPTAKDLDHLLEFGGFPEPFLRGQSRHYKRWQMERMTRVVQEDLLSLESVREVSQIQLLMSILPDRVGAPLSINNLSQDLSAAFESVDRWIQILENLYYCYRLPPCGFPTLRAAKKEKKLYLWDWSSCDDKPAQFENCVASHLLKYCHLKQDADGEPMELRFLRDSMKREIDFVVLKKGKPLFAVECKSGDRALSPNISYFSRVTPIPLFYQVHLGDKDYEVPACRARVMPFVKFAEELLL